MNIDIYQTQIPLIDFYLERDIPSLINRYKKEYKLTKSFITNEDIDLADLFYMENQSDSLTIKEVTYKTQYYRSLSVGDIVRITDNWFCCSPNGWNSIEPLEV